LWSRSRRQRRPRGKGETLVHDDDGFIKVQTPLRIRFAARRLKTLF
jgi:hypothetical protein